MTTCAPSAASILAADSPIPLPPPVTIATCPFSAPIVPSLRSFAGSPRPSSRPRLSRSRLQARLGHRAGLGSHAPVCRARLGHRAGLGSHALICRLASATELASALTLSFAGSPRPPSWPRLSLPRPHGLFEMVDSRRPAVHDDLAHLVDHGR